MAWSLCCIFTGTMDEGIEHWRGARYFPLFETSEFTPEAFLLHFRLHRLGGVMSAIVGVW